MNLLNRFLSFIKEENLFHRQHRLLLAVSGGVDSVVLCDLCKQAGFHFEIAHCNFQLRGEESSRDEQFVRHLADHYRVTLHVKVFETRQYITDYKVSLQVAARELRYEWFTSLLDVTATTTTVRRPDYLLTAHHADDNIETMLMNFFKGTGMAGLRGILPKQGRIVRPLLFAHKTTLLEYCAVNRLSYVEDSSNDSDNYTRNYFRHQLLPVVQQVFPRAEENLAKNLARFREIEQVYLQAVQLHKKKLLEIRGKEMYVSVLKLKKSTPLKTILYEIIKDYGYSPHQAEEVMALLDSESGKFVQSASHRIIKNRKWLIISPVEPEISQTIIINKDERKIVFENGTLEFKTMALTEGRLSADAAMAQLDEDLIAFPLLLRKRRQGDYFYPLGMQKKKKLNRFLGDQKLSLSAKEQVWILEMNNRIVWVVGQRIDDRFKITPKTSRVLQVSFTATGSK